MSKTHLQINDKAQRKKAEDYHYILKFVYQIKTYKGHSA